MQSIRYFLVLCCIWLSTAKAQDLNFININTDNGLPSNECYRIVQDKQGYIWVSTEMGLAKYNGREFMLFDAAKGLPFRNIYALDADSSGRVWFATGDWKVGYILDDKVTYVDEKIKQILEKNIEGITYSSINFIYKLQFFETSKKLYISTTQVTICVNISNNYEASICKQSSFAYDYMLLAEDKNRIFIGNIKYRYTYNQFIQKLKLPFTLFVNNNDKILLPNAYDGKKYSQILKEIYSEKISENLSIISIQNRLLTIENKKKIVSDKKFETQILCILKDRNKSVWVGCKNNGLYFFPDIMKEKKVQFLPGLSISNITEDEFGGLWITTLEKGIFYVRNKNISLLKEFYEKRNNRNYIFTTDNKLFIGDNQLQLGFISHNPFYVNSVSESIFLNTKSDINCLTYYKDCYYIGTSVGLFRFNRNFSSKSEILDVNSTSAGVKALITNKQNKLYASHSSIIAEIFVNDNKTHLTGLPIFPRIRNFLITKNNDFLVTTANGIYKVKLNDKDGYTKDNGRVSEHKKINELKSINKIFQDSLTNYWLLPFNDSITVLDSNFHLKSLIVLNAKNLVCREILEVNKTTFLISSNKGIIYIHFNDKTYKTYSLKIFDETHGINSSDIYKVLLFNNKFYVSTTKGICIFDKIEDLYHQSAPNTIISSIKVNDSCINAKIDTEFIYKSNNFSFVIDALTYKKINQKGTFFKYRLVGFDSNFKIADGNEITYNNLPPGTYTFIATAFYDDETEDTTPATFTFTVKPPFWQTWWGILLMLLLGISIVLLILEWRIKKIKKIEQEKAAINQTIAEYKFTALKAQMNPHFVFNSINVIQNLILEKDKQEAYNSLTTFSKLIRKILNQSDSVYSTVEDELELTKAFINLNKLRVDYPFEFFETVSADAMQCYIPSLIIQPFIENSLWHGILPLKGSKVGIIKLNISLKEGNILNIIIQDNGIGRKAASENKTLSTKHISKGLTLIKERLEAYRVLNNNCIANLTITDIEEGSFTGTFVELNLELPHDE